MGLFDSIFGSGPNVYVPKNTDQVNNTANQINNASLGYSPNGQLMPGQQGATPYIGASGVNAANAGYNYAPLQQAQQGLSNMPSISATYTPQNITAQYQSPYQVSSYTPTQQNYQTLPDQYYQQAYGAGADQIKQAGQGAVDQARESVGPRNLGALNAATQAATRQTDQNLAGLSGNLGMERMQEGVQTGIAQQQANEANRQFAAQYGQGSQQFGAGQAGQEYQSQLARQEANAGQQYQGYQSQLAQQTGQAGSNLAYLQGLAGVGGQQIGLEQGATNQANAQEIQRQQLYNQYLSLLMGSQNTAAGVQQQGNTAWMNALGNIGGSVAKGAVGG
jgi:hypothetical protein